jgi:hypothetical protein
MANDPPANRAVEVEHGSTLVHGQYVLRDAIQVSP